MNSLYLVVVTFEYHRIPLVAVVSSLVKGFTWLLTNFFLYINCNFFTAHTRDLVYASVHTFLLYVSLYVCFLLKFAVDGLYLFSTLICVSVIVIVANKPRVKYLIIVV